LLPIPINQEGGTQVSTSVSVVAPSTSIGLNVTNVATNASPSMPSNEEGGSQVDTRGTGVVLNAF